MTITAITQTNKTFTADTIKEALRNAGAKIAPVRVSCDQCAIVVINGVVCHESGCPNAWRDEQPECKWCGQVFKPEQRHQEFCSTCCSASYHGGVCDCEHCKSLEAEPEPEEVSNGG